MPKQTAARTIDEWQSGGNSGSIVVGATGGGGGGISTHDLAGPYHIGTLADTQAPQFLKTDGTRSLTGNLTVADGVTIDGADISVLAGLMHTRLHAMSSALDHSGEIADAQATRFLHRYNSWRLEEDLPVRDGVKIDGYDISELAKQTHDRLHDLASPLDHKGWLPWDWLSKTASSLADLETRRYQALQERLHNVTGPDHGITAAAWSVVGAPATNALGTMMPLSDVTATPEALLKSDSGGGVKLRTVQTTVRTRTPLVDTTTGDSLTLQPDRNLNMSPGTKLARVTSDVALQSDNFASGATGWRMTYNGQLDTRFISADELRVKSFVADLEQALAGGQIISKSVTKLATAFVAPSPGGATTLTLEDLPSAPGVQVFSGGDYVALRTYARTAGNLTVGYCWGTVSGYTGNGDGTQTWTFTRSTDNAGAVAIAVRAVATGTNAGE